MLRFVQLPVTGPGNLYLFHQLVISGPVFENDRIMVRYFRYQLIVNLLILSLAKCVRTMNPKRRSNSAKLHRPSRPMQFEARRWDSRSALPQDESGIAQLLLCPFQQDEPKPFPLWKIARTLQSNANKIGRYFDYIRGAKRAHEFVL